MKFLIKNLLRFMGQRTGFSRNNSGFTLAEVMVATGILSILSLTVAYLTKNISKVQRATEQNVSVNSLRLSAFRNLRDVTSCGATLNGIDPSGVVNLAQIRGKNGASVITSGAVYGGTGDGGNAASKLRITGIVLSNYHSSGDAYRSGGSAAVNTMDGSAKITISYIKGNRVSSASSDAKERGKSTGSIQGEIIVPVSFAHVYTGSAINPGAIQGCAVSETSYVQGICDSLNGQNTADSKCREITVNDSANDYSVSFKGNVNITNAGAASANNNELIVEGSIGIGRDSETDATGKLSVASSLAVGLAAPAPGAVGTAEFLGAVGIGVAPAANDGSLRVNGSAAFGSGMTVPGTNGSVKVKNSVGVGVAAPAGDGDIQASNSMGIGASPPGGSGDLYVANGVTVGAASALEANSLVIQDALIIPNQAATDSNGTHAATQYWVASKVANSLDPNFVGDVTAIIDDIMSGTGEAAAEKLCLSLKIRNADETTFSPAAVYDGNCTITPKYCSTDGQCAGVYAGTGGIDSAGKIESVSGDIISEAGDITASGDVKANIVRAESELCFGSSCKTSWSSISITRSGCSNKSAGVKCASGEFVARVMLSTKVVSYKSSYTVSPVYYAGKYTSVGSSTGSGSRTVGDTLTYTCCKANNN